MVIRENARWRKDYREAMYEVLNPVLSELTRWPEILQLPITSKYSMFEFGGSAASSGLAMLIATPSGFPNAAIALNNRRPNGLHAASRLWSGAIIGIAHHVLGITTIGIYQLLSITPSRQDSFLEGKFKYLAGIWKTDMVSAHDLRWISPYDGKYKGLKKFANVLLRKLESYECTVPLYIEPLRSIRKYKSWDPDPRRLLQLTDLTIQENDSLLVPKYVQINRDMADIREYRIYSQFESTILDACHQYMVHPFVYVMLSHHLSNNVKGEEELQTHAYVCYQSGIGKPLLFHRTGYKYIHTRAHENQSTELESYIQSNYNHTYLGTIVGLQGGNIAALINAIRNSQDGCRYVYLRYCLSTQQYK